MLSLSRCLRRQPLKTEYVTIPSLLGNGSIRGYFVRPAKATGKLPAVLVVHENRGLNPYIEDVARRLGTQNYLVLAPDGLTSVGGYPGDEEKAVALFNCRPAENVCRLRCFGRLTEGASRLHRQDWCLGLLLWRSYRQQSCG